MSDTHSHDSSIASADLFDKAELAEFVTEDQLAGRIICKMLSALFVYTLIAISGVVTWTYLATH